MGVLDWLKKTGQKGLTLEQVKREEIRLGIRESQSLGKMEKMEKEREEIFAQGSRIRSPLKRRQLARTYEMKTRQGQMMERELAMISKELTTLSALRLALERKQVGREGLSRLLMRVDEVQLMGMLEDDKISSEMYMEKLNDVLGVVTDAASDITQEVGTEGNEVMQVWQKMDEGEIESYEAGLKEARSAVNERIGKREAEEES